MLLGFTILFTILLRPGTGKVPFRAVLMVSVEVVECPQSPVVTGVFPEKLHRCLIVSVPMNNSNYRNDRIWTCDPMLPRQVLYQAELHSGFHFVKSSCIFRSSAGGLHIHLLDGRGRIICFGSNSLTSRLIWFFFVRMAGLGPATHRLKVYCSTNWATSS